MKFAFVRAAGNALPGILLCLLPGTLVGDPFDIVLSEIHYNPVDGASGEFVELYHAGTRPQALDGWRFTDGITFTFPKNTVMFPGDHLAVALNATYLRSAAGLPAGDRRVVGNFSGRLADGGERLRLVTPEGITVFQTAYSDEDPWPAVADGFGPSLEMRSPLDDVDLPGSWSASRVVGGTPARENSVGITIRRQNLIAEGDSWKYRKGTSEPPGGALDWTGGAYDDSGWDSGPTGIGAGDGDDATVLSDMPGGYTTVYLRKAFDLPDPILTDRLRLSIVYQDGFVAYLNGREVARRNLGTEGTPVPHDALASAEVNPSSEVFNLSSFAPWILPAGNVLAVQAANQSLADGRVSIIPELFGVEEEEVDPPVSIPLAVNEVKGGSDGFVEVLNTSSGSLDLTGLSLVDYPLKRTAPLPGGSLAGGGKLVVAASAFSGPPAPVWGDGVMVLVHPGDLPSAPILIDSFKYHLPAGYAPGYSFGRYPDGSAGDGYVLSAPSPMGPNAVALRTEVVINEINYHPQSVSGADLPIEFVEIYNRSSGEVDLTGWRFTRGIPFDFAAGTKIPAGGYLVIAPDPAAVMAQYGITGVLGGFDGGLKNSAEVLRLEDPLGNPADRIRYADDGSWPLEADGSGKTIELRNPALENALGQSWAASAAAGTPGGPNSVLASDPSPALDEIDHVPLIPTSSQDVWVTVKASDDKPGLSVTLRWKIETDGSFASVPMLDDGLSHDGLAGDGLYGARIPARPADSIVLFYAEAVDSSAKTAVLPRSAPGATPLYMVRDITEPGLLPRFRAVMTRANRTSFESRCDPEVDYIYDCTLIYGARAYYNSTIRYRGHSSRCIATKSFRFEVSHERPLEGITDLVFNGRLIYNQRMCWDLARRVGIPYCRNEFIYLSLNESDLGIRLRLEHLDDEFIAYHFPGREGGNLYRGIEYQAHFTYTGASQDSYRPYYQKENNPEDTDIQEIVDLCDAFTNSSAAEFAARVGGLIDAPQWIQFFALENVVSNNEGGIWNFVGDDYYIYHMPATDTEPAQWKIIPWDFDDSFYNTSESVPVCTLARPLRLINNPVLGGPNYFGAVRSIAAGQYHPSVMNARIDTMANLFPDRISPMKTFVAARSAWILARFSPEFTAEIRTGDLLPRGSEFRFWRGTSLPAGGPSDWTTVGYPDGGWESGPAGFGYSDNDDRTVISDMQNRYTTLYIRRTFQIGDPSSISSLALMVNYDDAFVAFLNGTQVVVTTNYTGPIPVPLNATSSEHEAGTPERFELNGFLHLLQAGNNVLAIVGINRALDSGDFSLDPWLVTTENATWGCGESLFTGAAEGLLTGKLPLLQIASVTVNGAPAELNLPAGTWSLPVQFGEPSSSFEVAAFNSFGDALDTLRVLVSRSGDDTMVSGTISSDVEWGPSGSPYILSGDVEVASSATLTIDPGTTVLLAGSATLIVRGRLLAQGTLEGPILFARSSCAASWGGIAVIGSSAQAQIAGISLERSGPATDGSNTRAGVLSVVDGRLEIAGSRFQDLTGTAVSFLRGTGSISGSTFAGVSGAVRAEASRVTISGNEVDFTTGETDGIVVVGGAPGDGSVEGNLVIDAGRDGIVLDGSSYPVTGNIVTGALRRGISLLNGSAPALARNVIYFCDTALSLGGGVPAALDHMTIAFNSVALDAAGASTLGDSILWGNYLLAVGSGAGQLIFQYCNVDPEDLPPGPGNIDGDPRFADFLAGDFRLLKGSAAVAAASDGSDMGAIAFDGTRFIRGDANEDDKVSISDAVAVLEQVFRDGISDCPSASDVNDDGEVDLSDTIRLLFYIFTGGPGIPAPFPACGPDPTSDGLPSCSRGCSSY